MCYYDVVDDQCAFHFAHLPEAANDVHAQIILSDAIVLFRACVIWACNRVVQITSLMLFVPLFGKQHRLDRRTNELIGYMRSPGLSVYNVCVT